MKKNQKDDSWKNVSQAQIAAFSLLNIIRLLWINRFEVSIRYVPRLLWGIFMSIVTSPLRLIERLRFNRKIKRVKITKDPIFIIGIYRTATTLLHTFLSMDKNLGYLSNLDGFIPLFNLSFPDFGKKTLKKIMPKTRPMDNVELFVDSPQEEHFATASVSKYSMINALVFPRNFDYFAKFISFKDCPQTDVEKWKKIYHYFVQKTTLKHQGKQLVLKNPVNSARIKYLLDMYPNAKFIYTYRNPYTLFLSIKNLFRKITEINTLQTWKESDVELSYLHLLKDSYEVFKQEKELIPPENFYAIKYEDFIFNPLPHLEEIYQKFEMEGYTDMKKKFQDYIEQKKDYKPNKYKIKARDIDLVNAYWNTYRKDHGYERVYSSNVAEAVLAKSLKQKI